MALTVEQFLEMHAGIAGCWPWHLRYRDKDGYCHIKINQKMHRAHSAVYALVHGTIPSGLYVLHRCDNRACCNPDHLFLGTARDNAHDAMRKDRHSRGTRNGISKLTDDDVRAIRASTETQWTLARRYGVWQGTIWHIKAGIRWKHVV